MITLRRASERGRTDWGWLDSRHTWSFGEYFDPKHMGFRSLRVINDDRVAPGQGFGTHGHRDMEILSYVLEGGLQHKDSTGGGGVIRPGEIQFMRAGTGVTHSEYNASKTEPVHFLQIWVVPDEAGLAPAYGQKEFDQEAARSGFVLLATKDGREGTIQVHQDLDLLVTRLAKGERRERPLGPGGAPGCTSRAARPPWGERSSRRAMAPRSPAKSAWSSRVGARPRSCSSTWPEPRAARLRTSVAPSASRAACTRNSQPMARASSSKSKRGLWWSWSRPLAALAEPTNTKQPGAFSK